MFKLAGLFLAGLLGAGAAVAVVLLILAIAPWCLIWAINTLVAAGGITTFVIPFTVWTWLAGLVLVLLFYRRST